MNTRTTKLAAAGVLALTLPLATTAEAVPLYRFDQPRAQSSGVTIAEARITSGDLDQLDEAHRTAYEAAAADADAAISRACNVLAAVEADDVPTWQALTEVGEAEIGLLAARAHVRHVAGFVDESSAADALAAMDQQLSDLLGVLETL
ncbi:hypothetical protein [Rarobacter faecitabidus]|nr:hypothetical protein [Rarobacter faecitabidus]